MMWSIRTPPACRSTLRIRARNGWYSNSSRRSGRHGGCDQSWPSWLNSSGGAPADTPRASASCSAQASAPSGCTPTARSCMMPNDIPADTAWVCAAANCSSSCHCSQRWKSNRGRMLFDEFGDAFGARMTQRLGPLMPVTAVLFGKYAPGGELVERRALPRAIRREGEVTAGRPRNSENQLQGRSFGRPRRVPVDRVQRRGVLLDAVAQPAHPASPWTAERTPEWLLRADTAG